MVRPSFVPTPKIRALRDLLRSRKAQADGGGKEIQHFEKILEGAGHHADLGGSDGLASVFAAHDRGAHRRRARPQGLARMVKSRLRSKLPQLERAFSGRCSEHRAFLCTEIKGISLSPSAWSACPCSCSSCSSTPTAVSSSGCRTPVSSSWVARCRAASVALGGTTVVRLVFGLAPGLVGLAFAGRTLHELATWRAARELGKRHWLASEVEPRHEIPTAGPRPD